MAGAQKTILRSVLIQRIDEARREVFGEVGVPLQQYIADQVVLKNEIEQAKADGLIHYDNGCWVADDIRDMAHLYLIQSRAIDQQHNRQSGVAVVIESFIATAEMKPWREGAWVIGVRITDDAVWQKILTGEYKGFSVRMLAIDEIIEIVVQDGDQQTRLALKYFRSPTPLEVSIVETPATGILFEVVRMMTSKDLDVGALGNPEPNHQDKTSPASDTGRSEGRVKKTNLIRRFLQALVPIAREEGIDIDGALVESDYPMDEFATVWSAGEGSVDLNQAIYLLGDLLYGAHSNLKNDPTQIEAIKALIEKDIDQFKVVIMEALALSAVPRSQADQQPVRFLPVERSTGALLSTVKRRVTERVGKKISAARMDKIQAAIDAAITSTKALEDLLAEVQDSDTPRSATEDDKHAEYAMEARKHVTDAARSCVEALKASPPENTAFAQAVSVAMQACTDAASACIACCVDDATPEVREAALKACTSALQACAKASGSCSNEAPECSQACAGAVQACTEACAAAAKCGATLAPVDGGVAAREEDNMDAETIKKLEAENEALKADIEKAKAEAEAAAAAKDTPPADDPAQKERTEKAQALEAENANLKVELEKLRSARPAPQGGSDDKPIVRSADDKPRTPEEVFRAAGFFRKALVGGGVDRHLGEDPESDED